MTRDEVLLACTPAFRQRYESATILDNIGMSVT
jgi:hypothetical protein